MHSLCIMAFALLEKNEFVKIENMGIVMCRKG